MAGAAEEEVDWGVEEDDFDMWAAGGEGAPGAGAGGETAHDEVAGQQERDGGSWLRAVDERTIEGLLADAEGTAKVPVASESKPQVPANGLSHQVRSTNFLLLPLKAYPASCHAPAPVLYAARCPGSPVPCVPGPGLLLRSRHG